MKRRRDPLEPRHADEARRAAFKAAAPIAEPVPYVQTFTAGLKLKPAVTRFGKRKVLV